MHDKCSSSIHLLQHSVLAFLWIHMFMGLLARMVNAMGLCPLRPSKGWGRDIFASNYHHTQKPSKNLFSPLHKCLFIQVHYYNTMCLNHGIKNHDFKPWVIYKRRGFDPTPKPLRLFCTATPLTSFAPKPRSFQNKGPWRSSPNKPLRLTSVPSRDTLLLFWRENIVGEDSKILVDAAHDIFSCLLLLHDLR